MFFRREPKVAATGAAPPSADLVQTPAANTAESVNWGEPDMLSLGRAIWRNKGRIVAVTVIATAATFTVVNAMTPRYRSEARLLLEARQNVFLRPEADKTAPANTIDPEAVTSQIQVVLSRDLAREVIKKENLTQKPEFDAAANSSLWRNLLSLAGVGRNPASMSRDERALEAFYEHLNVFAIEKSRVIAVDFTSADPELAARVANDIAETYLTMQQTAAQDQTRAAGSWLAGEIIDLRKKVADAEAKVDAYRANANLFSGSNNTSLPTQQLTELNSQIAAVRGQKADLDARTNQLHALIDLGWPIESSEIANSEPMRRLFEQRMVLRQQLAEQSTTLMGRHPRIKELRAQIAESDRQIRSEVQRLAGQLDNDAKLAGDRLRSLLSSLDLVKKQVSQQNEQDVQLRALERDAKTERDLLENYLAKYREASARDNINAAPPEARIISRASPAIKPDYPKKTATVLIAAFAAFALSAGFAAISALLAPPPLAYGFAMPVLRSPVDVRRPLPETATPPPDNVTPMTMETPLAVTGIAQVAQFLRDAGEAARRVSVFGASHHVGTTSAAIALARTLARDSSVVLVEFAFNAPNLATISDDPLAPGLTELVHGQASFGEIITRDQHSSLHLIPVGNVGSDAASLLASPMLATVIAALSQNYDYVVIDAGSAYAGSVERVAPYAPCAVLVASDTTASATRAARDRLIAAGFGDVPLVAGGPQAAAA